MEQLISIRYKKTARNLSISKRFDALTTKDKTAARKLKNLTISLLVKNKIIANLEESERERNNKIAAISYLRYLKIVIDTSITPIRNAKHKKFYFDRGIDSFTESQCWNFFETRKEDLHRLFVGFRIPENVKFDNGCVMSGEEVMLRGLYELVSGEKQFNIAENVFGGDQSRQSRAFNWFIDHIYSTFLDLMTDNLNWWSESGYMEKSANAIYAKMKEIIPDLLFEEVMAMGFIDCNCMECCRVGGGPREEGPNADRWHCNIQRAFYNGWKSIHGLKHQTFDNAYGITMDMYGPTSLRRNDLKLLGLSRLNQRLQQLQAPKGAFGDSIYPTLSHISSYFKNNPNTPRQILINNAYKKVRISIEWNYMVTANTFSYLKKLNKLKIMKTTIVSKIYTVCTFLRNCHICLYGGISSGYFNLLIDDNMLEKYLRL